MTANAEVKQPEFLSDEKILERVDALQDITKVNEAIDRMCDGVERYELKIKVMDKLARIMDPQIGLVIADIKADIKRLHYMRETFL